MKRIIITSGDKDGIGLEVCCKALLSYPSLSFLPILWVPFKNHGLQSKRYLNQLNLKWNVFEVESLEDAYHFSMTLKQKDSVVLIRSNTQPPEWVEQSAIACLEAKFDALVTGPLSKTLIKSCGFADLGHTEILKRVTKAKQLNMAFFGKDFSVVLTTDHISIDKVTKALTKDRIERTLKNLVPFVDTKNRKSPIGFLGLNPHAGEDGIISPHDQRIWKMAASYAKKMKLPLSGPLVPDAAFNPKSWSKFSFFVAQYHDQGLIPFKMHHGQDNGVHVTLGLPFVRTSVDHGTAKDIFDKNIANPNSMIDALNWALKLTRRPSK